MVLHQSVVEELITSVRTDVVGLIQDLVRIPSENKAPWGDELHAQRFLAAWLGGNGFLCDVFTPDEVEGIEQHPAYCPGRTYENRPNVVARLRGSGGGRSFMLSGHIDTVQPDPTPWQRSAPFSGDVVGTRLYGRGSYDMKGALAASAYLLKLLRDSSIPLRGDVFFESVVDEERCGGNGTLASRLRGYLPDAVLIPEMSDLAICPSSRGAKVYELAIDGEAGHSSTSQGLNPIVGIALLIAGLKRYEAISNEKREDGSSGDEDGLRRLAFGALRTDGTGSEWDFGTVRTARVSVVALTLPGETEAELDERLTAFVEACAKTDPILRRFPTPRVTGRSRYVLPAHTDADAPVVGVMRHNYRSMLSREPVVRSAPFACDAGIFTQWFHIPTMIFGPIGAHAHAADEYVDLGALFDFMRVALGTIVEWCT